MDTVFISIIIDNYNYERYLVKAIDSALRQTYPYREVIVVDDGSTDDSLSIIESYGSQIRAVLKDNGGQASAFNAGWEICQGDLVIFLDSDDILLPAALEAVARQYEVTVISALPNCNTVCRWYHRRANPWDIRSRTNIPSPATYWPSY
ncbi:MAG: glycosyltransferase [Syntrophomonadaceae bacterium]|nr:glycosyltransferase [Syntrophomonadaceae bacterium]